ncbi:amino acid adenylation domain-containing protein [Xenorhabdus taiwanensis]|uniref:Carrier domain-containing protein n=1 Tax=Xenorhabdus taiwanensis TaxID=3085177 RepID=A0ABN7C385_9GAMM|nr:hypothetical protein TCT1_17610 [Xenorhabdus sp. TCT-1]
MPNKSLLSTCHKYLVHQLVEQQVLQTPEAIAVRFGELTLTYAELNRRANRLAHYLRSHYFSGQHSGDEISAVGIYLDRSIEMIVAVLGVLKAGAAYVPVDLSYPAERQAYILHDSGVSTVITRGEFIHSLPATVEYINLDQADFSFSKHEENSNQNLVPSSTADSLAYLIYTSGSTGKPKGVCMPHRALVNLLIWQNKTQQETLIDKEAGGNQISQKTLQFSPLSFDVSFQEIFSTLCCGGELVLISNQLRREPLALLSFLSEQRIERLFLPYVALNSLASAAVATDYYPESLRDVITAGEKLVITAAIRQFFKTLSHCRLHNQYGPSETHVVTAHTLNGNADQWSVLPTIGRPIDNTEIYLLDDENRLVADGSAGELCVAGMALATGYHRRPEETVAQFINIVVDNQNKRLYRTGDLAQWRADGQLELLGRIDFQVKIRGYRVELGEVEAQLMIHALVKDAVVIVQGEGAAEKHLIGFIIVSERALQRLSQERVKESILQFTRETLPDYMCPTAIVIVVSFPLSASGKIDRRAFPVISADELFQPDIAPAANPLEQTLVEVWSDLLCIKKIGRHSHFLQLGGHSLLVAKMMLELRHRGLIVDAHTLYQYPVLSELAEQLQKIAGQETVLPEIAGTETSVPWVSLSEEEIGRLSAVIPSGADNIKDIYPLGSLQQGMLYFSLTNPAADPYILWQVTRFRDADLLHSYLDALRHIIARYDALRVSIHYEGLSQPVQVVWRNAELWVENVEEKLKFVAEGEDLQTALKRYCNPATEHVDMTKAPLQRCLYFFDNQQNEWILLHLLHHMTVDHTTIEKMQQEIEALLSASPLIPLPPDKIAPQSFRQTMVELFHAAHTEGQKAFFDTLLEGYEPAPPPFGINRYLGGEAVIAEFWHSLPAKLGEQVRQQARMHGVSVAAVFHLAWAKVIACLTGQDDVVFGTVLLGRLFAGELATNAMGQFINTLPLRINLRNQPVLECLWETQDLLTKLVRYEQASLAQAQKSVQMMGATPLFTSLLNYRHSEVRNIPSAEPFQALNPSAVAGMRYSGIMERTNYPIAVNVDDFGQDFVINAQVEQGIDPELICAYLHTALEEMTSALANTPEQKIGRLNILPAQERDKIVNEWNKTHADFPHYTCLHTLIEAQVQRIPEAIALEFSDQVLSYDQLNQRANQLAHYLRDELKIGPDTLVGLCMERSIEMVVALLAILKAGGAYVPLDPDYPRERLGYMLHDAAPWAVLSQTGISPAISTLLADYAENTAARVININQDGAEWSALSRDNLPPAKIGLTSSHLAYVIYTSGSTGRPKGVMNEHRGVVNRLVWMQKTYSLSADDAVLQKTPFSFDVSVWEFFWPLMYGARLVIAEPEGHKDPLYLSTLICQRNITTLHFVPSMLAVFLQHAQPDVAASLRQVFCSGEALPAHSVLRFHQQLSGVALHNLYGPTEAAIDVTAWNCSLREGSAENLNEKSVIPIGKPIDNIRLYILDNYMQPTAVGVAGELHIAGIGVARGYLNQAELTAEKFIRDPFSPEAGQIMYRTGDLARYLPNGDIEYLGRNDFQIKLRGLRIEAGEIEAALLSHESVKACVVMMREDIPGDARLVAYVTATDPDFIDTSAMAVKQHIQTCLPAFMIPSHIIGLAELPLSANGKLDRRALPAPTDIAIMQPEDIEPPRTETEIRLAQLWRELLAVNTLGRQSHFFEAGGHSLLAVTLMMRIKQEFGVGLLLSSIVSHLDLASQAELIDVTRSNADTAYLAQISLSEPSAAGLIRALPSQKSIYKALKLKPQDLSNNSFIALSFDAEPDLKLLRNLLQSVLSRHTGLSAQFMLVDNELYLQPAKRFILRLEKRQSLGTLEEDLRDFIRPFSLEDGMNVRGRWLVAEPNPMLLLDFSHACIDGSGLMCILDELATTDNTEPVDTNVSLAAYSALFYGSEFTTLRQQHAEFWYTKLQGWQLAFCPDDSKEAVTGSCLITVNAEKKAQIEAFTSHFRISVPEFFMTVFLRLKSYLEHSAAPVIPTNSEQLISTIFHGRDRLEQQAVIAPLMAVLPVRVTLYGKADDEKNAQKDFITVSQEVREACRHYLFDAEELQSRYPALHSQALMPTTFFGYFQKAGFDGCICGISCHQLETAHISYGQSHWDLTCEIAEHPAGFDVHLEAFSFRATQKVERWGALFSSILQNALNK